MLNKGHTKPFLTFSDQLDLLKSRGLIVTDDNEALQILSRTNYYRLSAYSLTLRKNDVFYDGVTFDQIYEIYRFDDAFRKLILDFTSYVEISSRTKIAYCHAQKHGALAYLDTSLFENKYYHH